MYDSVPLSTLVRRILKVPEPDEKYVAGVFDAATTTIFCPDGVVPPVPCKIDTIIHHIFHIYPTCNIRKDLPFNNPPTVEALLIV